MNNACLVMITTESGGYWHPTDLFHDVGLATAWANKLAQSEPPPHSVAVFPVVIDWSDRLYECYPRAAEHPSE